MQHELKPIDTIYGVAKVDTSIIVRYFRNYTHAVAYSYSLGVGHYVTPIPVMEIVG